LAGARVRKTFQVDDYVFESLRQLAADRGITVEAAVDEALRVSLRKHGRPADLQEALLLSLREFPLNDNDSGDKAKRLKR
jgi:hypothetical protein